MASAALAANKYPDGFARAGGATLPLKQRREALEEYAKQTEGIQDAARKWAIVGRIVRKKWKEVAPAETDVTNFSFGPSAPTYEDPNAGAQASAWLKWLLTTPDFAGCLDEEEMQVWSLTFADHTQSEVAAIVSKTQGSVSKIIQRAVRKLNARFLELRDTDRLPLPITAWLKAHAEDSGQAGLYQIVDFIRQRDRESDRGRPIGDMGCRDMDELRIRRN